MSSIRWGQKVGDWYGYYIVYKALKISSFEEIFQVEDWPFEPIYYLSMRIVRYCFDNYILVVLFMAVVAIGGFYIATKYFEESTVTNKKGETYAPQSNNFITVYFIYWCSSFGDVYVIRQNMAISLCYIAFRYVEERKPIKFLIMIMIATLIHFSSIVFLIIYPLYNKKFNIKSFIKLCGLAIACGLIRIEVFFKLVAMLGGRYAEKVMSPTYNTPSLEQYFNYSTSFIILKAVANFGVVLIICMVAYNKYKEDRRFNGMLNVYLVGVVFWTAFAQFNIWLTRISTGFIELQCFIIPYAISRFDKKVNRLLVYLVFLAYMILKFYYRINSDSAYSTFTTIFSEK